VRSRSARSDVRTRRSLSTVLAGGLSVLTGRFQPFWVVGINRSGWSLSPALRKLLTRRYTTGSVILTSNRGFDTWSGFLGDEVVAAAVLDRFLHFATVFTQNGESYRLKEAKRRRATGR
jgi:hypothetical protein